MPKISVEPYDDTTGSSWLICFTCGTQFPTADRSARKTCHICDDPRQYVPAAGQSFTTLASLRSLGYRNEFTPYEHDPRVVFVTTTPKLGIGQRAAILRTASGNVMWDCVALLDDETEETVRAMGGLEAIVISHPHYYTTHVQWARRFRCPVYVAAEDRSWTTLSSSHQVSLTETETDITGDVKAIKLGGHFPGSLVLLFEGKRLFVADTLVTTPAGLGKWRVDALGETREKPPGLNSFAFMWSIPNYIPLDSKEMARMWAVLKNYDFQATHGAFAGLDIEDKDVKGRVRESMLIQAKFAGGSLDL